jgi:hypothetical protein
MGMLSMNRLELKRTDGLQIIDVSNKTAPILKGSNDTNHFDHGLVESLYIFNNLAYLGGSKVFIVDVSNKENPFVLDSFDTQHTVSDLSVSEGNTYIADNEIGITSRQLIKLELEI